MKAGDTGWVRVTVAETFKDGTFFVNANGFHEDDDVIPDHPALPAVARWLAEHGRDDLRELLEAGAWVIRDGGIEYDDTEYGEALAVKADALIAALEPVGTEGQA